jgi:formylglycine-generating enzyme required for sulfatase activity
MDEQKTKLSKDDDMKRKPFFLIILLLCCILASGCGSYVAETPTVPPAAAAMRSAMPTALPTITLTSGPAATSTPALAPGAVQVSEKDGMQLVYVPAGLFIMGSFIGTADEQPEHSVYLDAFWIDKTEVTNGMYALCVQSGSCQKPPEPSNIHSVYYSDPQFAEYPVIALDWSSAEAYCSWAGRRLPTEAEWEKAARGTDGRNYPWGDTPPNNSRLNFNNSMGDPVPVGGFQGGASPYGVLDMAGNVNEWVEDWYDADYYTISPHSNPTGPDDGILKVLRGGSWHTDEYNIRSADRHYLAPDIRNIVIGFRCALTFH